jgi:hypothetical protein
VGDAGGGSGARDQVQNLIFGASRGDRVIWRM